MPQPDYENDLVFPPEKQTTKMQFYRSDMKPDKPMYIISDTNHIGWYYNGKVSYFTGKDGKAPKAARTSLDVWCEYWMPLIDVCRAAQGRFGDLVLALRY